MKYAKKAGFVIATLMFLIFTLSPFICTFIIAITPDSEMFLPVTDFLPKAVTFDNFWGIFSGSRRSMTYINSLKNSCVAVLVTISAGLPICLMTAYALSRREFKGRLLIKNLLLITMVIPVMATIIPIYKLFADGKMLDNMFWLCIVYVSSYLPMATWMMTNYFSTIPKELIESARIDGCGEAGAFFRIILPLSLPIVLSVSLIMFLSTWSQFQIPLILASSMKTKPMAIVVSEFVTKDTVDYGLIAAAGLIALIPPALCAVVFRKYLVSGITGGAVKG